MKRARRDTIVTLADARDVYNFRPGQVLHLHLSSDGSVRIERWYEGVARRVRNAFRRATRWFRPRYVVDHIEGNLGLVSIREERWSWRRWRWQ